MSVAVELDRAGELCAGNDLVHPVQDPEEGRLPAPGRADESGHLRPGHGQVHRVEHKSPGEPGTDALRVDLCGPAAGVPGRCASRIESVDVMSVFSLLELARGSLLLCSEDSTTSGGSVGVRGLVAPRSLATAPSAASCTAGPSRDAGGDEEDQDDARSGRTQPGRRG